MPYKRFATPCLIEPAKQFLRNSPVDYRNSVKQNRQRIGYPLVPETAAPETETAAPETETAAPETAQDTTPRPDRPSQEPPSFHQPIVDHSLIWRMVGWLGSLSFALNEACRMILQRDPNSLCHRYSALVDPAKARSDQRQKTLETAEHLLHVIDEWEAVFGEEFFPRFATRSGFD